jgi:poly-gamma-glutamate synthesis protein (capsule biosynthesis protein)
MKEKFLFIPSLSLALIFFSLLMTNYQLLITSNSVPSIPIPKIISHLSPPPAMITLIAVGDIMLGRSVNAKMRALNNFNYPFLKTADFLRAADITFINLESPFYDDCPTTNTGMIFCADPKSIDGLVFAGVDIVNLANNHIRNYGKEGVEQTINLLDKNNISFTGISYLNDIYYYSDGGFIQRKVRNTEFGFLGFDLTSGYQEEKVVQAVRESSPDVDILIVSFHWGTEYAQEPSTRQIELAHRVIGAGADLILGHHPHVIQKTEDYHEGKIVYSLGNFVFDQPWSEATKKGLVGIFTFQGKKLVNSEFKEVSIKDYSQPEFLD